MEFIKKNIVVILAFMLPILLIIGLAVSVYLPGVFLSTQYDFVYATCGGESNYSKPCDQFIAQAYKIENGKLVPQIVIDLYNPHLFLYDTKNNESREITLDQARGLELSPLLTSPDGVSVDSGYNRGSEFFPFFDGSSNYGFYLTKGSKHRRLNLLGDNNRYYSDNNFKFIGWIINQFN